MKLRAVFGFLVGIAAQIVVPLTVERLAAPATSPRVVYLPQSFADAAEGLDRHLAERGRVPSAEEGLAALVPAYLPALPLDPWTGAPYLYEPAADGASAELFSYGEDRAPGGNGTGADLSLRALSMGPPPPPPDTGRTWLVNLSFLAPSLFAYLGAGRWFPARTALSGCTLFSGALLAWAALTRLGLGSASLVPLATTIACAVLAFGAWRDRWKAFALLSVAVAWLQLVVLA